MSIASEITRLQTSKADVKTQVNIDKDLINNGTAFIASETVDDYDDKIEEMQEAYKKYIPIQTISGTEIQLDNSSNDKALLDIGLDGNTEQYTTTGKNLSYTTEDNGSTAIKYLKGNEVNIVNPSNGNFYNQNWNFGNDTSRSGKTYTIYTLANGSVGNSNVDFRIGKTGNGYAFLTRLSANTTYTNSIHVATVTLAENEVLTAMVVDITQSVSANLNIKIMVVEGSYTSQTIGDYEPYTGRNCKPQSIIPFRSKNSYWRKYNRYSRKKYLS